MRKSLPWYITLVTLVFLYLPMMILVIDSFNSQRFGGVFGHFTLKWYKLLLEDRAIWKAFFNSLLIGVSSTLVSTLIGTTAAYAIHRFRTKLQSVHFTLLWSPFVVPDILMGISLLVFFVLLHVHLGLFTIFLAHTTFCLSYVTFVMLSRLQNFDDRVIEAALDLGARPHQVIFRVFLPILRPAIFSAAILAFTLSFDDFVVTYFVAGPGSTTLPLYVYSMVKVGTTPVIHALSTLVFLITFLTVFLTHHFWGDYNS